jgi:pSer/pThr/pTyr-binding forkhead associated (FHA) protein
MRDLQAHIARDATISSAVLIETDKHVIYKLDKPVMTIGSAESDDIFVEGFFISDEHVIIEKEDDGSWISANKFMGKFKINGKKESRHKLQHKDRIELGTSTFRYMENEQKV